MTEKEATAIYMGINLDTAAEIYVDDISDEDYNEILELMNEDLPDWWTKN